MAETTQLELVYRGEEVDDGSMPIGYVIYALSGFSGAYEKISGQIQSPDIEHHIRVVGLRQAESTHIVLDVIEFIKANPAASTVIETGIFGIAAGAYKITKDIASYIEKKKHSRGRKPTIVIEDSGIFLVDPETEERVPVTKEEADRLLQGYLDSDIEKMILPLNGKSVAEFEIRHSMEILVKVTSQEKPYFVQQPSEAVGTRTDVWLEGTLNSLSKDRATGTFYAVSGKHIPYRYVGADIHPILRAFAQDGIVHALCDIHFDNDNIPTRIDIKTIEIGQRRFWEP